MSAAYKIGSNAEIDEALILYESLSRDQQVFFLHYMRSTMAGYKPPDDLPNRFWIECYDQWKSGVDPFSARTASGEAVKPGAGEAVQS